MGRNPRGQSEPQEGQHRAPAVLLRDVAIALSAGGRRIPVLDIPVLEIPAGGAVGIAGPSGSGKTTLLNVITGMLTATLIAVFLIPLLFVLFERLAMKVTGRTHTDTLAVPAESAS